MKDETDFASTNASLAAFANARNWFATESISAGSCLIEQADDIKQGGFTTTRGPHNHNELAAFDGEVKIFESK